jgi:hypothetical protein
VLFNQDGGFIKTLPCAKGISPRMNYFALAPNRCYVTLNDGVLYLLKADGTLQWEYTVGLGFIPARIFPTAQALYVILPQLTATAMQELVFDYAKAIPVSSVGAVPCIQYPGDVRYALTLEDMHTIKPFAAEFQGTAWLLFVNTQQISVWKQNQVKSETILLYSANGKLLNTGTIVYPEGLADTGFWTCVDDDLTVYKNYFYNDYMEIVGYRF